MHTEVVCSESLGARERRVPLLLILIVPGGALGAHTRSGPLLYEALHDRERTWSNALWSWGTKKQSFPDQGRDH